MWRWLILGLLAGCRPSYLDACTESVDIRYECGAIDYPAYEAYCEGATDEPVSDEQWPLTRCMLDMQEETCSIEHSAIICCDEYPDAEACQYM